MMAFAMSVHPRVRAPIGLVVSSCLALRSPPPDVHERLRAEVLERLKRWVRNGWGIYDLNDDDWTGWLLQEAVDEGMDCADWDDFETLPESWFVTRAESRGRDWFKREMRRRDFEGKYARVANQALTAEVFGAEDGGGRGGEAARLVRALETPQRQVIEARIYKDLPWKAVAASLGVNERRAKYLYKLALAELRFWLGV